MIEERRGAFYAVVKYKDPEGKGTSAGARAGRASARPRKTSARCCTSATTTCPSSVTARRSRLRRGWLHFKRTDGTAARTLEGYEDHTEEWWTPALGHCRLTDLYANPSLIWTRRPTG